MPLHIKQKEQIENLIINCLREKFQKYNPESNNMPFHYRLLGKDRMALYSFIQSLSGEDAYEDILYCFERAGIKLRPEIDNYFSKFK
ncbi:MAG: TdeIII family type II restriction endonuclease [Chitinispirillaceae bacterium]|nr:TdeIII family type II restriction endonuclease [Chitinispirillaceae bacterium]